MNRDKASLLDIIQAARKVLKFSQEIDQETLGKNEEKQSAILYQVIIIGEAVKRLSGDFREKYSDIPWRDILTHQYDRINFNTLWDVIRYDIPELLELVEPLMNDKSDHS